MVARGRNSTSDNHCAIDRSICVRWHGVYQFLARRNIHGTFKQTGLRYSSRQLCHCVMAGSSVARQQYMSRSCRPCHPAIAVLSTGCRPLGSCSRAAGWSAATSCVVQFFGRRHEEAIHALRRPASEKRQCTKSREVGHWLAASAMGI